MMPGRRAGWIAVAVAAVAAACFVAMPTRHAVEGLSMAPGLLPGDVVTGRSPAVRVFAPPPRRFDRWLFDAPAAESGGGITAIKRVVGLAGERVSIVGGDLFVDDRQVPPPPALLAEMASTVFEDGVRGPSATDGHEPERGPAWTTDHPAWRRTTAGRWCWHGTAVSGDRIPVINPPEVDWLTYRHLVRDGRHPRDATDAFVSSPILDDAPFAPGEHRRLLPVRDVGIAALLRVAASPAPARCLARVGDAGSDRTVAVSLPGHGRLALVAGRLDGHLVAAAWTLPGAGSPEPPDRSPLPPGAAGRWSLTRPWPSAAAADRPDTAPSLSLGFAAPVMRVGTAAGSGAASGFTADPVVVVERLVVWRDVLQRPAEDGTSHWDVGRGQVFVLGDFPSASRDSRHWGPIEAKRLLHRVDHVAPAVVSPR